MWSGSTVGMRAPVRYLSYSIDTVLLTAALMLATMLHRVPFVDRWLTIKLCLVALYILLGSLALKRAQSSVVRRVCFIAAAVVFAAIYATARGYVAIAR
jgi:uncharacterized membrane protein SirB2